MACETDILGSRHVGWREGNACPGIWGPSGRQGAGRSFLPCPAPVMGGVAGSRGFLWAGFPGRRSGRASCGPSPPPLSSWPANHKSLLPPGQARTCGRRPCGTWHWQGMFSKSKRLGDEAWCQEGDQPWAVPIFGAPIPSYLCSWESPPALGQLAQPCRRGQYRRSESGWARPGARQQSLVRVSYFQPVLCR